MNVEEAKELKKLNSLLLTAASRGSANDVAALLDRGAQQTWRDKQGLSSLHFAAGRGHLDVVRLLWSRGAELDIETIDGLTPLHVAAGGGHVDVVTFLLKKGAWGSAESIDGFTPAHLAARYGCTDVMSELMDNRVDCLKPSKVSLAPASVAVLWGHPDVANLLDKQDQNNLEQISPLHAAVMSGNDECVALLLAAAADSMVLDAKGRSAVNMAENSSLSQSSKISLMEAQRGKQTAANIPIEALALPQRDSKFVWLAVAVFICLVAICLQMLASR